MGSRLVLGWSSSPWELIQFATGEAGRTTVVTDDDDLTDTLKDAGLYVIEADPRNRDILEGCDAPRAILIGDADVEVNRAISQTARAVFPDANIIIYSGETQGEYSSRSEPRPQTQFVDHDREVGRRIVEIATSATAVRAHRVRTMLDRVDGRLCVFMHDNPDPDALASAVALRQIAITRGIDSEAYYYGDIVHQSNRAFVNLLDLPVTALPSDAPLPECEAIALVDHALPGINDSLPTDVTPDFVFDHHTPSGPVEGRYVDLRESVGATSSIMVEYLKQLEIDFDENLATALLNGIRTDTKNFSRKSTSIDFTAAGYLWDRADHGALERIENPSLSRGTLGTIGNAISNRHVRGSALSSCVGEIHAPDALAQAAELLLQMNGIDVLLVYGIAEDTVHASARSRPSAGIDLAEIMRDAFAQIGTAGGHEEMAGAQIPVGMLASIESDDSVDIIEIVREVIDERFFETIQDHKQQSPVGYTAE